MFVGTRIVVEVPTQNQSRIEKEFTAACLECHGKLTWKGETLERGVKTVVAEARFDGVKTIPDLFTKFIAEVNQAKEGSVVTIGQVSLLKVPGLQVRGVDLSRGAGL